jgi:hypothetical protein
VCSILTTAYNKMGEVQRNSEIGKKQSADIAALTDKISEAEHELGNFHRQVGNYAIAGKELKAELGETTNKLLALIEAGQKGSEEYWELFRLHLARMLLLLE